MRSKHALLWALAILTAVAVILLVPKRVRTAEPHRISVFSARSNYSIDTFDRDGLEYVGLIDLLEPMGRVEARTDGKRWTLSYTGKSAVEFKASDGERHATVNGKELRLPARFVLSSGRGFIPVSSVPAIVRSMTGENLDWRPASKRLLVGNPGIRLNPEFKPNPSRVVLTFPIPASPAIRSDGNSVRLTFTREPVVSSGSDSANFTDPTIQAAALKEIPGGAEYVVRGSVPLTAQITDGGRTITIAAKTPTQAATAPAPATQPPAVAAPVAEPPKPRFLVVIDAAHGGSDPGATLTEKLMEKDVTLALARRLAHELQSRGAQVTMARTADTTLTGEQRALAANTARASVYVTVHAAQLGQGVRVFTSAMPPSVPRPKTAFVAWEEAQSGWTDMSNQVAGSVALECDKRKIAVKALPAKLAPLSNVAAAAIAIELAPRDGETATLNASDYQQDVAAAVATGIVALRGPLEAAR